MKALFQDPSAIPVNLDIYFDSSIKERNNHMNRNIFASSIEYKLRKAAAQLPSPTGSVPVSPEMKKLYSSRSFRPSSRLQHIPVWQMVLMAITVLFLGSATALAASPELRAAVVRFFSSGTVEKPPVDLNESFEAEDKGMNGAQGTNPFGDVSPSPESGPSQEIPAVQTVGSLTLTRSVSLDEHFAAIYASSPDFLNIVRTPSGTLLLSTTEADTIPRYYSLVNGILTEITLEPRTLSASVELNILPGVMNYDGDAAPYRNLKLPKMTFDLVWQQYGDDVLINYNATESEHRFDIGSTYGVDLGDDYDGAFSYRALPGSRDVIQVSFDLDSQRTEYSYPFLLNLTTGQVSNPLAEIDLSAYACITELNFTDDLTQVTAWAGRDHDHLQRIIINLADGSIEESSTPQPPVDNCLIWFATGDSTVFYTVGSYEEGMDGFIYNSDTQTTTTVFTNTYYNYNVWADTAGRCFFNTLGGGYCIYYEEDAIYLMSLSDGSKTLLEDVPLSQNLTFFFNPDHSLLQFEMHSEGQKVKLGFIDPARGEAWYFDREPAETIHETSSSWYSNNGFYIEAQDENTEMRYLYLYEYTP